MHPIRPSLWQTLRRLAELGAHERTVKISTVALARSLNLSQQTVSRHLIKLDHLGMLNRRPSVNGVEITLTAKGVEEMHSTYITMKAMFEGRPKCLVLNGTVFTGLGEGGYYVNQLGYKRQFERLLGFTPYPGTLNVKLPPSEILKRKELESYPGNVIEGFTVGKRSFGEAKCYPATIGGIECAIVLIRRTHHDESVLEIIAPVHIRSKLNLEEGSKVQLVIRTNHEDEGSTRTTSLK